MPSTSKKQRNFMAAAAHNPAFAKKVGIPVSVAKEFNQADKGRKFREGGATMVKRLFKGKETPAEEMKEAKALKSGKLSPKQFVRGEKSEGHKEENSASIAKKIKSGKMSPSAYAKMESKEPKGMRKGGSCKGYAAGGSIIQDLKDKVMGTAEQNKAASERMKKEDAKSPDTAQAKVNKVVGYKSGGSVRGCGCAVKGKTKGRMV